MRKLKVKKGLQLINKVLKWHFNYYILNKPTPLICGFYITSNCNLKCDMCNLWRNPKKEEFDFDLFKKVVDDLSKSGCYYLSFTGGEPLVAKNIFEMLAYSKERIPFVHMVTNGQLVTKDLAKRLSKTNLDEISISLDGLEKTHDKIRGVKGSFKKALESLQNLKTYAPNVDLVVNTIISPENIDDLPEVVELVERMRLKHQFQPLNKHPIFENQKSKAIVKNLKEEEILKINNFVKGIIKKRNVINSKYFLSKIPVFFRGEKLKGVASKKCINPYFFCEFRENNELYPCLLAYNWKNGFKLKNGLNDVFRSKEYKKSVKDLKACRLCQKSMFVCYWEPKIILPITNFLRYNLL